MSEKTGKAASDSWYDSLAKTVEEKLVKAVGGNDTKGKKESGSENDGNIAGKAEVVNSTVEGKGSNAISYGVEQVDYKMIEKNTIFTPDGGLSFNGVWNWTVYNTNHYWMVVERRNSVVDNDFIPPKNFVYAFTHCVSKENVDDVVRHARIEQKDMESGKRANSRYRILHFLMEIRYGGAFSLGKHKMTDKNMKNENWGFLMPSRNNPFQNYYRMVRYEGKNSINA